MDQTVFCDLQDAMGPILVDAATRLAFDDSIQATSLGHVHFKGFTDAREAYGITLDRTT